MYNIQNICPVFCHQSTLCVVRVDTFVNLQKTDRKLGHFYGHRLDKHISHFVRNGPMLPLLIGLVRHKYATDMIIIKCGKYMLVKKGDIATVSNTKIKQEWWIFCDSYQM